MKGGALAAAASLLAVACNPLSGTGTLQAKWTTPAGDSAAVTMPVTGRWCVGPGRLDIRAAAGDTGVGLAVFASDSSALEGRYLVMHPDVRVTIRPASLVALRWMSKITVEGWWGDSGSVTLSGGAVRGLSGSGKVWLVSGLGPDSLTTLDFSFRGVRVQNDTLCDVPALPVAIPVDSTATLPPSGVH